MIHILVQCNAAGKVFIHISRIVENIQENSFSFNPDFPFPTSIKIVIYQTRLFTKINCMKKVYDILARKGKNIINVSADTSVLDALKIMADQNIGSVVVVEGGKYLGILTERDYSRKVILKGKSSTDTKAEEIMSSDIPRVTSGDTIDYCMQLMSDKNIRYLPVFDGDNLSGIISINDVVKETILAQQETITQLKDYLHSSL